eukprot:CAMPEP_0170922484 /NCGR_PEP_ID=MMETSP0735-20130129/10477_1 /TAXON_ID=186038 /ORGANISM="Fragilariopsis kerguelensis, Strain L26-C5" /LENGTH=362 /DNA_ID=CAMNT_0011321905 /DNA_START=51 /DNA_END=1139 /DNA_ORIENTATION=+
MSASISVTNCAILLLLLLSNIAVHGQGIHTTTSIGSGLDKKAPSEDSTISGRESNIMDDDYSTIVSGQTNIAPGIDTTVLSGEENNRVEGNNLVVSGNENTGISFTINSSDVIQRELQATSNNPSGDQAFIGLGTSNDATGAYTVIGGGSYNIANATHASILGGFENTASGQESTISGGDANIASAFASTVGGGYDNTASGYSSTVSGGGGNVASGIASMVGGGSGNTANGDYSIAMGIDAKAETDLSCVINLLPGKVASSTKVGEFLVSSKAFTIRIGSKKVTIDKKNIKNFKNLLKNSADRRRHLEHINKDQQAIIEELQKQVNKHEARIVEQQVINNKQEERINALHRMLIDFVGRSTE